MRSNWDEMLKALVAFQEKNGHCDVSACDRECGRLGQWVSSQRYKRRIGTLPQERIDVLNGLGFTWSASDRVWRSMFQELVAYAKAHKTTDISERFPENQKLSNWVHNQRHRKKIGRLDADRARQLESIGFCWSVRRDMDDRMSEGTADVPDEPSEPAGRMPEERLYLIRGGLYVQYGGRGRKPRELADYLEACGGEFPAYIPLPAEAVIFSFGNDFLGGRRIRWAGKGPLPEEVLAYVRENGSLPRYEPSGA